MSKRLILSFIFFMTIMSTLVSCTGTPTPTPVAPAKQPTATPTIQDLIVGNWQTNDGETQVSFDEDGTFIRNIDKTGEELGTYKIRDANLDITIDRTNARLKIEVQSNGTLLIETETGEEMKFQRVIP